MKKKTNIIIANLVVFSALVSPAFLFAQSDTDVGLVKCFNGAECGWKELIGMINGVINFLLFKMAVPIAAIMFFYAGFKMVTAGGEAAHAREQAKSIFSSTVVGLVVAVASWIIVKTIFSILGYEGDWIGF